MSTRERLTGNGGVKGVDWFPPLPLNTPAPSAPAAMCAPPRTEFAFGCHLCGKVKSSVDSEERALYLLAFHYDRRHKNWTAVGRVEVSQTHQETKP